MRINQQERSTIETRIRAAADRLLDGRIPAGGKCDVVTLAKEAGVSRSSLYTTYIHLKLDFEQRRDHLVSAGHMPDPREAQLERLKTKVDYQRAKLEENRQLISELKRFQATAVSQIAAQHEEIRLLREKLSRSDNVTSLLGYHNTGDSARGKRP